MSPPARPPVEAGGGASAGLPAGAGGVLAAAAAATPALATIHSMPEIESLLSASLGDEERGPTAAAPVETTAPPTKSGAASSSPT